MYNKLILASASPRRRELLTSMGYQYEVIVSEAEELKEGTPAELVQENARRKALAVSRSHPDHWVIGSDTLVFLEDQPLGKPKDAAEACAMLKSLRGKTHRVLTGIAVVKGEKVLCRSDCTYVTFDTIPDEEIDRYVASGEPADKAGAYAIQGIGGMYIREIRGNYSNVIGLNTCLLRRMLAEAEEAF